MAVAAERGVEHPVAVSALEKYLLPRLGINGGGIVGSAVECEDAAGFRFVPDRIRILSGSGLADGLQRF